MNSPEIVAALREHAPEAPGELYDSQADSLYQYCWLMLRNRETAQVAVRDAIVAAEAPCQAGRSRAAKALALCPGPRRNPAEHADRPVKPTNPLPARSKKTRISG